MKSWGYCESCDKLIKFESTPDKIVIEPEVKSEPPVMMCDEHPKYRGLRKSRTGCPVCIQVYENNADKRKS